MSDEPKYTIKEFRIYLEYQRNLVEAIEDLSERAMEEALDYYYNED